MPASTRATANRAARQEALREFLSGQKLIEKVIDNIGKLEDDEGNLEAIDIQRLTAATNSRLALIKKIMPDLKSQEITGTDGGPLNISLLKFSTKDID